MLLQHSNTTTIESINRTLMFFFYRFDKHQPLESFVFISLIAANMTAALRERVASLEDKIHNLYQILALQAILVIAILVYKSFSY